MAKPLKFYQTINQAPRSAKHGKHRRAGPAPHSDPIVGTDLGAGGSDQGRTFTVTSVSHGTITVSAIAGADWRTIEIAEPKPPTIPYAGIRTGELIGHRLWWVIEEAGRPWLCSLAHRQLWRPGETISGEIDRPVEGNGWFQSQTIWGGVYSFAERDDAVKESEQLAALIDHWKQCRKEWGIFYPTLTLSWTPAAEANVAAVLGTVRMWGDVVEHETGYRAQFAKIHSLDQLIGEGDIDALRSIYGVSGGTA